MNSPDVKIKIYGEATVTLSAAGSIGFGDTIHLSNGTVAIVDYYDRDNPNGSWGASSEILIGSSNGHAGYNGASGSYLTIRPDPTLSTSFYGSQPLSSFTGGSANPTIIHRGTFYTTMTTPTLPVFNAGTSSGFRLNMKYDNVPPVGAIGNINIGTGDITPGTACTIDNPQNAIIATHVIEAGMDQIRAILGKIDNASSALNGVAETQIGVEEALGNAIEELTAADITECMSEIIAGQMMVQYATAVWLCQKRLEQLALETFKKAVTGYNN